MRLVVFVLSSLELDSCSLSAVLPKGAADSSGLSTLPNRSPRVSLSLGLVPSSRAVLEKPVCIDEFVGLEVNGSDFADEVSVGVVLVSAEARRALAFGLKMSPKVEFDPPENNFDPPSPENTGPPESGGEDIGVKPGAKFDMTRFGLVAGAAGDRKEG